MVLDDIRAGPKILEMGSWSSSISASLLPAWEG